MGNENDNLVHMTLTLSLRVLPPSIRYMTDFYILYTKQNHGVLLHGNLNPQSNNSVCVCVSLLLAYFMSNFSPEDQRVAKLLLHLS